MYSYFRDNAEWMHCGSEWGVVLHCWTAYRPESWVHIRLESDVHQYIQRYAIHTDLHKLGFRTA